MAIPEKFKAPLHAPEYVLERKAILTHAQLMALNAVPITVLPAPGAGYAHILEGVSIYMVAGVAFTIGLGTGIGFKYTDTNGLLLATCAVTGFVDQATAQVRYVKPTIAATPNVNDITPVANAVIVAQSLTAELTDGGTRGLTLKVHYRKTRVAG